MTKPIFVLTITEQEPQHYLGLSTLFNEVRTQDTFERCYLPSLEDALDWVNEQQRLYKSIPQEMDLELLRTRFEDLSAYPQQPIYRRIQDQWGLLYVKLLYDVSSRKVKLLHLIPYTTPTEYEYGMLTAYANYRNNEGTFLDERTGQTGNTA